MTGPRPLSNLASITPYQAGAPAEPGGHKLSSNENPLGCSPAAREAMIASASSLEVYPDGGAFELRRAIGEVHGLDPDRLFIGAGSDEILQLVCRAFLAPGDEVIKTKHGFIIYELAARQSGATVVNAPETQLTADCDAVLECITDRTRIIFLANPNNPTGTYVPFDEIKRLHGALRDDILLVLDAAYAEYVRANDYAAGIELAGAAPNVLMTRTFSKIHGLAALRVGWCYGPANVISVLNKVRGPFNVNAPALAAAAAAVRDGAFQAASAGHNESELARMTEGLTSLGFDVVPSVANFVLVRFADHAAAKDIDRFLQDRGIVLRRMEPYGLPESLRLSIGSVAANDAVLSAFAEWAG
ncbi:MAG: histidinol-phosphate transaminase [Pseudomonadota bacterium]